jgi:predicted Zn-dependent peptidase
MQSFAPSSPLDLGTDVGVFELRRLRGGCTLVLDSDLGLRSVTVVIAVPLSSRDETSDELGISHLLEHVVIAAPGPDGTPFTDWVGLVGGESNATTAKESVTYWARVPPEAAREAVRRLAQAVGAPLLTDELLATERRVIVQELLAAAADPDDQSTERFYAAAFPGHPLGQPVGGRVDGPELSTERLYRRQREGLGLGRTGVAVVGPAAVTEDAVAVLDETALADVPPARRTQQRQAPQEPPGQVDLGAATVADDGSYAYLTVGGFGSSWDDPLWAAHEVLAAAIGGLPTSPLYRRLRGELGVSYQLVSAATTLSDCGLWRVVAGCRPEDVGQAEEVVRDCLRDTADARLPAADLEAALAQTLGALLLDNEHPVVRAHLDAEHTVRRTGGESPVAAARRRLAAVDTDQVAAAAARVLRTYTAVVAT